jgi:outer membrane protein OmpA-like peptidoglycan-associated protein
MNIRLAAAASAAALSIAGCSHFPEQVQTLDQARTAVGDLEKDPLANDVAPMRLEAAQDALARANTLFEEKKSLDSIEQDSYVALRNAQIADQQIAEKRARDQLQNADAERNKILLQVREQQAQQATQLAQQRGEQLEQTTKQLRQQSERTEELQQQLSNLQAEQTNRGLVLTLNDVLFDFNSAALKPGADRTMQRLADFMMANPKRDIVVEGYTDSRGSAQYNRELSAERAQAVKQALVDRGISAARIRTEGLGEEYPVASNGTAAGRQLNRRVEIVLSDQEGQFAAAQRSSRAG